MIIVMRGRTPQILIHSLALAGALVFGTTLSGQTPGASPSTDATLTVPVAQLNQLHIPPFGPDLKLTASFKELTSLTDDQVQAIDARAAQALQAIKDARTHSAVITVDETERAVITVAVDDSVILGEFEILKQAVAKLMTPSVYILFSAQLEKLLQRNVSTLYRAATYEITKTASRPDGTLRYQVNGRFTLLRESTPSTHTRGQFGRTELIEHVPLVAKLKLL